MVTYSEYQCQILLIINLLAKWKNQLYGICVFYHLCWKDRFCFIDTFFKNALMVSLAINIGEIIFQGKKVQETQAIQMKKVKSHLIVKSRTPRNLLESRNQLKIQTFKITMAHLTQISLKLKLRKAMNTVLNKMYLNPMC